MSSVHYADDSQCFYSGKINEIDTLINKTEITLKEIRTYFLQNGLQLNINKTQCIFLDTRKLLAHISDNTTIRCADGVIQPFFHVKNLGLILDSHMTFDRHINKGTRKTMGSLIFINRHKYLYNKETRILVAQTLVVNIIKYGITIGGTTNSTLINKVQKLQNFAINIADRESREIQSCHSFIQTYNGSQSKT